MEKGAQKILAKHGCLYMKDDYKALFEELEAYYKPTEVVKNNAVLPHVSNNEVAICPICEECILINNVCPKCTVELCSPPDGQIVL